MQQLIDRQDIADLVSRLGLWLDGETTLDQARAILADDVSISTPGGEVQGIERAVEQARRNHDVETQHVITNLLVDVDGDTATAGANAIITFPDRTLTGRYAFETRRTAAGWRLTKIASG
jgi:SnoaL-like domain